MPARKVYGYNKGKRMPLSQALAKRRRSYAKRTSMRPYIVPKLSCKRMTFQTTWQFSTASTTGFWQYYTFTPNSMSNFAEFQNVFDEYKINAVKYTFRPRYDNVSAADNTAGNPQAYLHTCIDPSSTLVPSGTYSSTTLNTFLENDRIKTRTLNKPVSVYFKPRVTDQVQGGGTSARAIKPSWIKTSESTVVFRGFHAFIETNALTLTATNVSLDVFITFYVSFRNIK